MFARTFSIRLKKKIFKPKTNTKCKASNTKAKINTCKKVNTENSFIFTFSLTVLRDHISESPFRSVIMALFLCDLDPVDRMRYQISVVFVIVECRERIRAFPFLPHVFV